MLLQVEQAKFFMAKGEINQAVDLYREQIKPLLDRPMSRRHVPILCVCWRCLSGAGGCSGW